MVYDFRVPSTGKLKSSSIMSHLCNLSVTSLNLYILIFKVVIRPGTGGLCL
jgi:hypothetical protein